MFEEELSDDGEVFQNFVSICTVGNKLAVAHYDEAMNEIHAMCMPAREETLPETLHRVKLKCAPTIFILHPRVLSNKPLLDLILQDVDGEPDGYRYISLKASDWNDDNALHLLCTKIKLRSKGFSPPLNYQETYTRLAAMIDLQEPTLLKSLGGLINYMRNTLYHLDDESGTISINDLTSMSLAPHLVVDSQSVRALQISLEDLHPNVIKGSLIY